MIRSIHGHLLSNSYRFRSGYIEPRCTIDDSDVDDSVSPVILFIDDEYIHQHDAIIRPIELPYTIIHPFIEFHSLSTEGSEFASVGTTIWINTASCIDGDIVEGPDWAVGGNDWYRQPTNVDLKTSNVVGEIGVIPDEAIWVDLKTDADHSNVLV